MSSIQSENIEPSKSEISWFKYFCIKIRLNHFYDNSLPPNYNTNYYNVLIISQDKSGKSSVLNLFKSKDSDKSILKPLMNFRHINVDSESNDSTCLLNIWALESDINQICLTPSALKNNKCAIVFLVDLSKPYNIFNFLNNWIECISRRLENMSINKAELIADDEKSLLPLISRIPILILGNHNDVMETAFQTCQYPLPTCMSYLSNIALNNTALVEPNFDSNKSLFIPLNCDSQEKINEFGAKIPYLDISGTLSQYFEIILSKDVVNLSSHFKFDSFRYIKKYQAMVDDNLKLIIDECCQKIDKDNGDTHISSTVNFIL
ncbi:hypothetical protein MXB_2776 [Myxobolus squamalis]|nr:hypothetical protein MXB_2776 [Myxobolus squamalis]